MDTKICSKCGRELPLTKYHKNGFDRLGKQRYRGYCKDCANALERQRYLRKKRIYRQSKNRMCKM